MRLQFLTGIMETIVTTARTAIEMMIGITEGTTIGNGIITTTKNVVTKNTIIAIATITSIFVPMDTTIDITGAMPTDGIGLDTSIANTDIIIGTVRATVITPTAIFTVIVFGSPTIADPIGRIAT